MCSALCASSKKNAKKLNTPPGGRTQNLLIRSQTRCHYASRAANFLIYYFRYFLAITHDKNVCKHICYLGRLFFVYSCKADLHFRVFVYFFLHFMIPI